MIATMSTALVLLGCVAGPGGYAAVILAPGARRELSGGYRVTTNNRMEMMGAIAALESLPGCQAVTLYSDSSYLVNTMKGGWAVTWRANGWRRRGNQPALNPDLWERLLNLRERHRVEFRHIKGHAHSRENNRCDALANAAASLPDLPPDPGHRETRQRKLF